MIVLLIINKFGSIPCDGDAGLLKKFKRVGRLPPTMAADLKVVKKGWLTKEGSFIKSWKKRWFVILGPGPTSVLRYYAKVLALLSIISDR